MTITLEGIPKAAKGLPEAAQAAYVDAYNADFAWRCSEAHAEKAAWRAVVSKFPDEARAAGEAAAKPAPKAEAKPAPAKGTTTESKA